jgi:hypothetical protein
MVLIALIDFPLTEHAGKAIRVGIDIKNLTPYILLTGSQSTGKVISIRLKKVKSLVQHSNCICMFLFKRLYKVKHTNRFAHILYIFLHKNVQISAQICVKNLYV